MLDLSSLPSVVKVACFDIEIEVWTSHRATTESKFGLWSAIEQKIGVDGSIINIYKFLDTLIHEINHAIWWAYGIEDDDKEERVVATMATGWVQIYRDNPGLLKFIQENIRNER